MKVKIKLEGKETVLEAEELLFKALSLHRSGDVHLNESFDDPVMVDISNKMEKIHEDIYQEMMDEVIEALDEDYNGY